ncbi:hypothetical protein Tco_0252147 [Tanacetum coccineum]
MDFRESSYDGGESVREEQNNSLLGMRESLLIMLDNKEAGQDSDPSHPPGFTQEDQLWMLLKTLGKSDNGDTTWPDEEKLEDIVSSRWRFTWSLNECTWLSTSTKVMFVSIYAPQDISGEENSMGHILLTLFDTWDGECIIFRLISNEVRIKQERCDDWSVDVTFDEIKKAVWDCGTN